MIAQSCGVLNRGRGVHHGLSAYIGVTPVHLAHSIREGEGCGSETQPIGRVCGCGLRDNWNALAVEEKGSGGGRRLHHGPRVVMAPVMAASMAV